ncbi:hypothetical protein M3650_30035 [Paenibacillus sp. MER TA 81-3]|uniref:hypothetical protein n=1 Tax=Paenibacillus sp. MER TA 81-3 TaxID=2939573 RepID=UPI002040015C|nr:hypothetical protein [Paenibacillus sp. MER TA 81-3]MCM3342750.1 hypothetical protein [Paenibacillus sp. MER TA 81-3]
MSEARQDEQFDSQNGDEAGENLDSSIGANATSSAIGQGGVGGAGGAGGTGGQALNITYVDNYSIITMLYTIILMLADGTSNQRAKMASLLPMLHSIMEEQKEYRQTLLETLQSVQK